LAAQAVGSFIVQREIAKSMAAIPPAAGRTASGVTNTTTVSTTVGGTTVAVSRGTAGPHPLATAAISLAGALASAANFAALIWFGMWMGLTASKSSAATLLTIVFVQV